MRAMHGFITRVLLLAVLGVSGCQRLLPSLIVDAKNRHRAPNPDAAPRDLGLRLLGVDEGWRVTVGPPEASLAVWVLEPRDDAPVKGTLLVLHGFKGGPLHMLGHADRLRDAGYRTVIVGLRGHGASTGKHLTFGVVEKHDIAQVIDALEARGLIEGGLGILGMSYGAMVAIETAGHDLRVDAVVAMAGFSNARSELRHAVRTFLPVVGWVMSDEQVDAVIDAAGERAGFDPDDADAALAIARTHAPVLIVHGTWDAIVPVSHAHRLHAAAPQRSELMLVPFAGHAGVWMDLDGRIRRRTLAWFDTHLTPRETPHALTRR
jgi:pimeloyl-ACP methyl ester carboxylesterase